MCSLTALKPHACYKYTRFFFFFLKILFFPFSPQSPLVHSCVFFVVGSSSCGMWDAASAWSDRAVPCPRPGFEPTKHWAACSRARELNHSATGPAPQRGFFREAIDGFVPGTKLIYRVK